MRRPLEIDYSKVNQNCLQSILSGKIPAIIIHNFYHKKSCQIIANRIKNQSQENFQDGKLKHLGPFLMSYVTNKKKYFEDADKAKKNFERIFCGVKNPILQVYELINNILPNYSISLASEFQNKYSPSIIRIHEKGKSIPIHKDNVGYEGKEYSLSDIDHQLSCVLHLQESERGGDLVVYNKQWKKNNERFRNIDFGYSSKVIKFSEFCSMSNFDAGDLVIINPNYYHKVTEITGETSRITLGMFLGFYEKNCKVVAWA